MKTYLHEEFVNETLLTEKERQELLSWYRQMLDTIEKKYILQQHRPRTIVGTDNNGNRIMEVRTYNKLDKETKESETEKMKSQIQQNLDKFKELGINGYQHDFEKMNLLNPYFGFNKFTESRFQNGYGVRNIWMRGGADRIQVECNTRGYSGESQLIKTPQMSELQLKGILSFVKCLHDDRLADIQRYKANPKLLAWHPGIE